MGTITCTVNEDKTLTVISIAGMNPSNTWARLHEVVFEISGGGTFDLALSVVTAFSLFRFDPADPIDWITSQPSWLQISGTPTATALTLQADSSQTNVSSTFQILNVGESPAQTIQVTVKSAGGSGGTGGTLAAYVENLQSVLVGQLPPGGVVTGRDLTFGFKDPDENELLLLPAGLNLTGLKWDPSQPGNIDVNMASSQHLFSIDNPDPSKQESEFTIDTSSGPIDPTIITNPDESAP